MMASYLMSSEQTPSVVSCGRLVNPDYTVAAAGGIIIQAMPNAEDAILDVWKKTKNSPACQWINSAGRRCARALSVIIFPG